MTAPREHVVIADAIDSAMFVIQDLKTGNGIVTSDRLADAVIAALNAAGFVIGSGDMKREIENAAYERAKKVVRALEKPEPEYDHCDDERAAYLLGYDDAVESGCQEIDALITPTKTADTEG